MDERQERKIERFEQAMRATGRNAVERARVPGTADQVYCQCKQTTCSAAWTGPVDEWSCGIGFSSDNQDFVVRLCPEHDTPEQRAAIEAQQQASLVWRADAWDRLWTTLLTRASEALLVPSDGGPQDAE